VLGRVGKGLAVIEEVVEATMAIGAEAVGCMEKQKATVEYCKTRQQLASRSASFGTALMPTCSWSTSSRNR
jgi:alkylation response protein AidB-like acyl-CoA dehydrogenase